MRKSLAMLSVLLAVAQVPVPVPGQSTSHPGAYLQTQNGAVSGNKTSSPSPPVASGSQDAGSQVNKPEFDEGSCGSRQPIVVTIPPPLPAPWSLREQISWGASLVLVILGYIGVILALRALQRMERQAHFTEAATQAAVDSAHAALLNAQSIIDSSRPWLMISIEPFMTMENCFKVMATNRGRTPAKIIAIWGQMRIAADETHLPIVPEYDGEESVNLPVPIILLPGESTGVRRVSRDDVNRICKTDRDIRQVELWEERVFVYGKVIYKDLIAPPESQTHETDWCCWFIYGETQSNLVIAGPPDYNRHT
jgi:hypothetical protein